VRAVPLRPPTAIAFAIALAAPQSVQAGSVPVRARNAMVVSQNAIASQVGMEVMLAGGNAVDAAVATAFALAVVHPSAGNLGGGGFLLLRPARGSAAVYDFREEAPSGATPTMFLRNGRYSADLHHSGYLAVGVPGTVAGLEAAWRDFGRKPWSELLQPAIALAREGFMVSDGLARSLRDVLPKMKPYPASTAQFSRAGVPYEMGDLLKQPDLAKTLERISEKGAKDFYEGRTAELIVDEMERHGGLVTRDDLRSYTIYRRPPLRGSYRGAEILTVPPPSAGGVTLLQCLNVLEGYDVAAMGFDSSRYVHHASEALRRAFADRWHWLGDPGFVSAPVDRLVSKEYAVSLRQSMSEDRASVSSPSSFEWPPESRETTHLSVVDPDRNAVALTYTLEEGYGSKIVVPGAGFLLNNEMGDFNAGPGLTDETGLVGTPPNLAAPGKRMLSSMAPTVVVQDGRPILVVGAAGGRRIPSTLLEIVVDVLDFGMNVQEAIDAPRFHHQWLPDVIVYEPHGLSADTIATLEAQGHRVEERPADTWSRAHGIAVDSDGMLEGGCDRRSPDGAAIGR
jgi:gamma-glutamyltranspeptidase/glutathione hydrolase